MDDALRHRLNLRRRWRSFLLVLLGSGLLGVLVWASPFGQQMERQFGLELMFGWRGPIPVPDEVAYIPITHESAEVLQQKSVYNLDDWDRKLFARLVDRLASHGASVIVFDILFVEPDKDLVAAITRAKNVLLLNWVEQKRRDSQRQGIQTDQSAVDSTAIQLSIDQLFEPAPAFAAAAAATAPMVLHKESRKNRFEVFPVIASSLRPSIPMVALYLHAQRQWGPALFETCLGDVVDESTAIANSSQQLVGTMLALRRSLQHQTTKEADVTADSRCAALREALSMSSQRYFNFYGRPGALAAPPLHEFLGTDGDALAEKLRRKVVFVGIADNDAVKPPDSFDFVYRIPHGNRGVSGVELSATALANLSYRNDIRALPRGYGALVLLLFGVVLGLALYLLPTRWGIIAALVIGVTYAFVALRAFAAESLWLPLVIPLFVQAPSTVAFAWLSRLIETERWGETLRRFMPRWLREKILHDEVIKAGPEVLFGLCLHTDVAGYTSLSERLGPLPLPLKHLEAEYWSLIDTQVEAEQGERLEIAGDGGTCLWSAVESSDELCARACRGALGIQVAIDRFNDAHPDTPFNTRIGIHAGQVALGLVNRDGDYTRVVGGDVANTAARIENDINKLLGTRLLISRSVLPKSSSILARRVGTFIPRGKANAVEVYELLSSDVEAPVDLQSFEQALESFECGAWRPANRRFKSILQQSPNDGPSRFYAALTANYLADRYLPAHAKTPHVIDMNASWVQQYRRG